MTLLEDIIEQNMKKNKSLGLPLSLCICIILTKQKTVLNFGLDPPSSSEGISRLGSHEE